MLQSVLSQRVRSSWVTALLLSLKVLKWSDPRIAFLQTRGLTLDALPLWIAIVSKIGNAVTRWLSVLAVRGTIHPPRSSSHHLRPGRIPSVFLRFPWEQGSCYKRLTQELLRTPLPASHMSFGHTKPILVLGLSHLPFPLPETLFPALAWSAASHVLGLCSRVTSSGALPGYPDIPPGHHSLPHCPIIFSIALATL